MLIEDVFIIENLQVLNEGKNGPMKVRGVFQRADEENNNKRIYPKELLCREIEKLEESMKNRRLMGELDHPQHDSVKLSNVSHLITKLDVDGNEIIGEAEILDTPMGKVARALIEGGVQIGISSRGMGTLSEGQDGKRYVNEDFRLITWDLVADPSTRGAFPALSESTNLNSMLVEEILNDVLPKVTQEKVFSTLLRERLDEAKMKRSKKKKGKKGRKLDPVGKEDADVNNDGKVDSTDGYLKNRRQAIGAAMGKKSNKVKGKKAMKETTSLFPNVGQALQEAKQRIFINDLALEIDVIADIYESELSMDRQDAVDLIEHILHEMTDYAQNEMLNEGVEPELIFEQVEFDSFKSFLNESYDFADDETLEIIHETTLLNEILGSIIRKLTPGMSPTKRRQAAAKQARKEVPGGYANREKRKERAGDIAAGKSKFEAARDRVRAGAVARRNERLANASKSKSGSGETSQRGVGGGSSTEAAKPKPTTETPEKPKPTTETPEKPKPSGTPTSGSTALGAAGAAAVRRDKQARATAAAQASGRRIAAAMGNR